MGLPTQDLKEPKNKNLAIKNKDNALHKKSIEVYQKIATINNHIALTALGGCYEIGRWLICLGLLLVLLL
jgi:predicted metal-dependent RNase